MATSSPIVADASDPIRRASGRVRKVPEAYTSSPFSSGKRKRNNEEDGDVQMPDDYVSDEDVPSDDDEPAEEEIREQNRAARKKPAAPKKPAQKKVKTNGAPKALPMRPAAGGKKKKAPKRANATNAAEAEEAGGLYAEVFASDDTLENIVASWLRRFDNHESMALAEVVNFVLRSAGCESEVTEIDIEDPDDCTNKLTDIQDAFQATNPTEYPLIAKGKASTAFRDSMSNFLYIILKSLAAKGTLTSNKLVLENIGVWIPTLSSAANRAFRHTATIASLAVMTALCEITAEQANEASAAQRQAEGERKKSSHNKARVKQLEQKAADTKKAQEFLEKELNEWFNAVFTHRYRDIDPVLRRECAGALGPWISALPSMFFDGQHLRYLGWLLSDTAAPTRAEVIKQLLRLYKQKDKIAGLKTFTEKFRPRRVEIATSDAESTVRAAGIELLDLLRDNGLLEPDDVDAVGRLVYDSDPKVRKAVAHFFGETVSDLYNSKIDDLGGLESLEESLPEVSEGSFDTPSLDWLKFKSLAEMMVAYDIDEALPNHVERNRGDGRLTLHAASLESRFTLAADSLYDTIDEMKDWQGLAGYLLFDHSSGRANGVATDALSQVKHECVLTDKEEFVLLEVVGSSVKHLLVDIAEKSASNKTKLTKKQKDELKDEQEETARYLAGLIPKLLKKFGASPDTAAAVLRMVGALNLPSLEDLHQDSVTYGALLDDIRKQFMSHGADEVLVPASNAIQHAKSYAELDDLTEEKLATLWEDVVNNLADLLNPDTITVRGASNTEELVALSNNLLRIIRLSLVSNPIASLEDGSFPFVNEVTGADYSGAIDYVIALIQRALPSSGPTLDPEYAALEDEVAARAAEAGLRYLCWKVNQIMETVQSAKAIVWDDLETLATRRDTYVENLQSTLDSRKAGESVCQTLARYMLELHSVNAVLRNVKAQPGTRDDWMALVMKIQPKALKSVMKVFAAAEQNFAKLSNKKLDKADPEDDDDDVNADPMEEDPISDSEDEEDEDEERRHQRETQEQRKAVLAEQTLCELTGKLVIAIHADVVDKEATRKRIERNKTRLGQNYKEVCAYLDLGSAKKGSKSKAKAKGKATVNGVASKSKGNPKSNAIVAEDELDDEIEDGDGEDEEALRRRGLVVDMDDQDEPEDGERVAAEEEAESVLGD